MGLASDGAGGAFFTWADWNSHHLYAQHVTADGNLAWATPVAMSTADTLYDIPQHPTYTVADGQGGFITTWTDDSEQIMAQRCNADGEVQWTDTGALIAAATDVYYGSKVSSNGQGGAVMVWVDERTGTGTDIVMQGVSASGVAGDPGYTAPASASSGGGGSSGCFIGTINAETSASNSGILLSIITCGLGLLLLRRP